MSISEDPFDPPQAAPPATPPPAKVDPQASAAAITSNARSEAAKEAHRRRREAAEAAKAQLDNAAANVGDTLAVALAQLGTLKMGQLTAILRIVAAEIDRRLG